MISVILYGYHKPRRIGECLGLGMLWLAVAYGMLLLWAYEGIVCLVMALPLAIPVVLLGSAVGYLIQARPLGSADASRLVMILIASLPAMIGAESVAHPNAPLFAVSTAVDVNAPAGAGLGARHPLRSAAGPTRLGLPGRDWRTPCGRRSMVMA